MKKENLDVFTNPKILELFREFNENQFSVVMQVFAGSHLAIFLPVQYFQVETVNIVLCEEFDGTKLQDLTFQWIPLSSLTKPEFTKQYLSAFNFQIMSYCANTIATRLFDETL